MKNTSHLSGDFSESNHLLRRPRDQTPKQTRRLARELRTARQLLGF
jgi:hypothetical protein